MKAFPGVTLCLAGINGLVAVAALALAAHGGSASDDAFTRSSEWIRRGAEFQLWHSLALLGLAALAAAGKYCKPVILSATAFQLGILFFSGSLYWLGATGENGLGSLAFLTPMGGLLLMLAWILLIVAGMAASNPRGG